MKKIFLISSIVITIISIAIYIRYIQKPPLLPAVEPISECCESNLCKKPYTNGKKLQINGINAWYWAGFESFEEYERDIAKSKQFGFNHLRFNTMHMITKAHPEPPTKEERDAVVNILKNYYGNKIMPILFSQDRLKVAQPIEKQRAWIDFWLEAFPDVEIWDFYNEPVEGDEAFYNRIRELIAYLRTKTDAKITIGFHDRRPKAFEALHNECDIISYHFYPGHATLYGKVEKSLKEAGEDIKISCDLPSQKIEKDPYLKFRDTTNWLKSYNKPFIINEWGFAIHSDSTLEQCQVCYVRNILGIMKQMGDPNFLGHHYYNMHEPFLDTVWTGVLRYDGTARPVASVFE